MIRVVFINEDRDRAFSTVGLSRGITPDLTTASKLVLTLTMFIGRVGMKCPKSFALRKRLQSDGPESSQPPG
jgi:Trk-type K+ transport system membrane component